MSACFAGRGHADKAVRAPSAFGSFEYFVVEKISLRPPRSGAQCPQSKIANLKSKMGSVRETHTPVRDSHTTK